MKGIVYALTNERMPGLVKIGRTSRADVMERMEQLNSTGVPIPFECLIAKEVEDAHLFETNAHRVFSGNRVNPKREFFEVDTDQVLSLFNMIAGEDVTPEVEQNIETSAGGSQVRSKRRANTLMIKMCGVFSGATLTYKKDPSITCRVVSDTQVEYQGTQYSLSGLTCELMEIGRGVINGFEYWTYNDRTLWDLRLDWDSRQTGTP